MTKVVIGLGSLLVTGAAACGPGAVLEEHSDEARANRPQEDIDPIGARLTEIEQRLELLARIDGATMPSANHRARSRARVFRLPVSLLPFP